MMLISRLSVFFLFASAILFMPSPVSAHCDTYSGPVITAAKQALEKGDVTPLLKWVKKEYEEQIKAAFKKRLRLEQRDLKQRNLQTSFSLKH